LAQIVFFSSLLDLCEDQHLVDPAVASLLLGKERRRRRRRYGGGFSGERR
jgi:hypothetical protein